MRVVLATAILASLVGCSALAGKTPAESAVTQFHAQLDAGSFDDIYEQTDARFKNATTHDQFVAVLRAIHTKLGNVVSAKQTNWFAQDSTGGSMLSLTYETEFASGKGTEKFSYAVAGNAVRLVGYNINSADLIIK